jgi:hypothetical protein
MMQALLLAYALMQLYMLLFQIEQACASSISALMSTPYCHSQSCYASCLEIGNSSCLACCVTADLCLFHLNDDLYFRMHTKHHACHLSNRESSRRCQAQTALAQRFPNLVTAGRIAGRVFCSVAASVRLFHGLDLRYHSLQEVLHASIGAQSARL